MLTLEIEALVQMDAATTVDLSTAVYDPDTQIWRFEADTIGLVPLWTFPPLRGASDVWIEAVSPTELPGSATFQLEMPNGNIQAYTPHVGSNGVLWNVVVPQGALLRLATLATPARITAYLYGINEKIYADLTCCHVLAPAYNQAPAPPPA